MSSTPGIRSRSSSSVLDAVCGLDRTSPVSESELSTWLSDYPYYSKVFRRRGYEVVEVPMGPVEQRCAFVLRAVTNEAI
jgi:hypothetical protein